MSLYYRPCALMKGPAVRRFQEFGEVILGRDYTINDGIFGRESESLAKLIQGLLGLSADGVVGLKTWRAMFTHLARLPSGARIYESHGVVVKDCRDASRGPRRGFLNHIRTWDKISGVMLHQTGCYMPEDESVWLQVNAHCGITRNGILILMHPWTWEIWHGNGLSPETIGIEIAGNFYGVEGLKGSLWQHGGGPHNLNDGQKAALNALKEMIKERFKEQDCSWERVYAHRQSSGDREADPGQQIWREIAMPWLHELNATDGGNYFHTGNGSPIPREWVENKPTRYWH